MRWWNKPSILLCPVFYFGVKAMSNAVRQEPAFLDASLLGVLHRISNLFVLFCATENSLGSI